MCMSVCVRTLCGQQCAHRAVGYLGVCVAGLWNMCAKRSKLDVVELSVVSWLIVVELIEQFE